eukprot:COSAG06_NODE_2138_length_7498_cov_24.950554_4_plen_78_part_00
MSQHSMASADTTNASVMIAMSSSVNSIPGNGPGTSGAGKAAATRGIRGTRGAGAPPPPASGGGAPGGGGGVANARPL